jgi:hypothetical protein
VTPPLLRILFTGKESRLVSQTESLLEEEKK